MRVRSLAIVSLPAIVLGAIVACSSSDRSDAPKKDAASDAPLFGDATPEADAAPGPGDPCGDRSGLQKDAPWPLRGGCPKRAGVIDGPGPQDAKVRWSLSIPAGESSPALAADGLVWVGTSDGDVVAVTRNGIIQSALHTSGPVKSSPAIVLTGAAVVGAADGTVYGVLRGATLPDAGADADAGDDDGGDGGPTYPVARVSSSKKLGAAASSPAVGADGTVYVGTADGKLTALSTDLATIKWTATTNDTGGSAPAIAADGTIFVGSSDKKLYAIGKDGAVKWTYDAGAALASAVVGGDETIYVGAADGKLHAVTPEGKSRWVYATGGPITGSAAVYGGVLYVGSDDKKLHAVSTVTGAVVWTYATLGAVTSPVIGADGTIYAGSADGHLYAVTKGGTLYFAVNAKGRVRGGPAVAEDGTLYLATETSLVAIGP